MKVVADTGPLVAAINRNDRAHVLAARLVTLLGRELVVPLTVLVEVDQLVAARLSPAAARSFTNAVVAGAHRLHHLTSALVHRAAQLDERYADLSLGVVDTTVMALAEHRGWPILTFDFRDFRATTSDQGPWHLVVDEAAVANPPEHGAG